jgi:D-sedoheptulose 7-phosphate isomerase
MIPKRDAGVFSKTSGAAPAPEGNNLAVAPAINFPGPTFRVHRGKPPPGPDQWPAARSCTFFLLARVRPSYKRPMSFDAALAKTLLTFQALTQIRAEIERAGNLILDTLRRGNKLLIGGNGGSAAEAQHFSTELVGRYFKNRRSLPAIALNADGSLVTCIGNDFGFELVFARQIEAFAKPGDLAVMITSSGNSSNILAALDKTRELKLSSIALLGREGGNAKGRATIDLIVPGDSGRTAQEAHLFLIHHFCDLIDAEF